MRRIFLTALIAGLIAGLFATVVQIGKLDPLIFQAEIYESAVSSHEHEHSEEAWQPADGMERYLYGAVANIAMAVGFALVLAGVFYFRGAAVDARRGAAWGVAGFAVFALAPAFGLPPELPGSMAADLAARQAWWLLAAASTAAGIALAVFGRNGRMLAAAAFLVVLPHILGAPHPEQMGGTAPSGLGAEFASASLVAAAAFWLVLGTLSGYVYGKIPDTR